MRVGEIQANDSKQEIEYSVKKNAFNKNDHLGDDQWVELFPDGSVRDLMVTTRIPPRHLSYSKHHFLKGQSPLLVRKAFYDSNLAEKIYKMSLK